MDETLTPNILRRFNASADARTAVTCPDGHIYTLPKLCESMDGTTLNRITINKSWLDACNLEEPTTLDEFINVLRTFKEKDPGNAGAENVIPLIGSYEGAGDNPGWYIMNALGFNVQNRNDAYATCLHCADGCLFINC